MLRKHVSNEPPHLVIWFISVKGFKTHVSKELLRDGNNLDGNVNDWGIDTKPWSIKLVCDLIKNPSELNSNTPIRSNKDVIKISQSREQ